MDTRQELDVVYKTEESDQMEESDKDSDIMSVTSESNIDRSVREKKKRERKVKKQMMERNRRSRMSSSLQTIASFLVENKILDKSKKCEKVDILETLADYLEKTTGNDPQVSPDRCSTASISKSPRPVLQPLSSGELNSRIDKRPPTGDISGVVCHRPKFIPQVSEVPSRRPHELHNRNLLPAFSQSSVPSHDRPVIHCPTPLSAAKLYSGSVGFSHYPPYRVYRNLPVVGQSCIPPVPYHTYYNRQSSFPITPVSTYAYQPTYLNCTSPVYSDSDSSCAFSDRPVLPSTPGFLPQSYVHSFDGQSFSPQNLPR